MTERTAVLVGGGTTAIRAVEGLREGGFDGRIILITDEPHLPYDWLALLEGYLTGAEEGRPLHPHDEDWYHAQGVELRTATPVSALDRSNRSVVLASGEQVRYDMLLLAPGSASAPLGVPGEKQAREQGRLHGLDSLQEAATLRLSLAGGGHVVVVGAGWTGLSVAAAARFWGAAVVLLASGPTPLAEVVGPEAGAALTALHETNGVDVRTSAAIAGIDAAGVRLGDGSTLPADVVVNALPAVPRLDLAVSSGLPIAEGGGTAGVVVDVNFCTGDPAIWAAGSVAAVPYAGGRIRVDCWAHGDQQGYAAGFAMATGTAPSSDLPACECSAYGVPVEFFGSLASGYDRVVFRGEDDGEDDQTQESFTAFWLRGDEIVAAMGVDSRPDGVGSLGELVGTPHADAERLADPATPLAASR